ncbi:MAG TPA: SMC-Scp complex subunit ScpB [Rhodoblastus sp.]|nr:SMC-Scp complex subunit ScpB [Rhodoblastus sp.]
MAEAARAFEFVEDEDRALEESRAALLAESKRIVEALLFASSEPLEENLLSERLPDGADLQATLAALREDYATRGVNLARAASKWYFRTADDLGWLLRREETPQRKLTRAAIETLAIVAYHQPVTRAEIEDIRGVAISKGTLDVLLETGWIRLRGRRKAPGRPITYGTTDRFLVHFGLEQISDLPGLEELKGAGLFDGRLPPGFGVPRPDDGEALTADEDPLDADDMAEDFPLLAQVDADDAAAGEQAEEEIAEAEVEARLDDADETDVDDADDGFGRRDEAAE